MSAIAGEHHSSGEMWTISVKLLSRSLLPPCFFFFFFPGCSIRSHCELGWAIALVLLTGCGTQQLGSKPCGISLQSSSTRLGFTGKRGPGSLSGCRVEGQEAVVTCCSKGDCNWTRERNPHPCQGGSAMAQVGSGVWACSIRGDGQSMAGHCAEWSDLLVAGLGLETTSHALQCWWSGNLLIPLATSHTALWLHPLPLCE